jgi:hypothetical protein
MIKAIINNNEKETYIFVVFVFVEYREQNSSIF